MQSTIGVKKINNLLKERMKLTVLLSNYYLVCERYIYIYIYLLNMNVNKYIYSRPNKANRIDLHCATNYWSEVEEQSVERTSKIGLKVVEL